MSLDDPIAAMLGGSSAFVYTWVCVAGWSAINLALAIRGERGTGEPGWHADLGALRLLLCVWGIEAGAALARLLGCALTAGAPTTPEYAAAFSSSLAVLVVLLGLWLLVLRLAGRRRLEASPLAWLSCLVVPLTVLVDWGLVLFIVDMGSSYG